MMRLNLQLSCYNGARYLPHLFASLKKQTLQGWHLYVLDNASDEENRRGIERAVRESGLPATLDRVERNIGFAGAHNLLFRKHAAVSDAVQLLNDDAILEPDFLELCLSHLEKHRTCGSVSGAIFRWNYERLNEGQDGKTNVVDTLGLRMDWKGFILDRESGTVADPPSFLRAPLDVLGVSGCLPMVRIAAAKASSSDGDLFDGSYVSYKEDGDLALRLRAAGYTSHVIPTAVAYHRRSYGLKQTDLKRPVNESSFLSYRNHLWLLIAHVPLLSLFTNRIGVIPAECAKALYWLVRKPSFVWKTVRDTRTSRARLASKRAFVARLRSSPPAKRLESAKPKADVAVIMVSHNDLSDACLSSLAEARRRTPLDVSFVVVDNASTAYRANEFVERYFDDAWVLLRNGDFGYGRSMNKGAALVDAEYFFILNPDTVLADPDILTKLHAYMRSHPDVGLIGPKILNFEGVLQETCRRFPAWFQPLIQRTFLRDTSFGKTYLRSFQMKDEDHGVERDVDWVQGSAMFIKGDLWKRLGGFDDRYWMYFEDIDLCRKTWMSGHRVVYLPDVTLQHAHGRQSAKIRNLVMNVLKTKETRGHLASWMKYLWKWRFEPLPSAK